MGDRPTDILVSEVSFEAFKEILESNDFARTRPHRHKEEPAFDFIRAAREEGGNIVQDFHENMSVRGGRLYAILADVCAFANTNGGTLFIGLNADMRKPVVGVKDPKTSQAHLEKEISNRISPPLKCNIDVQNANGKQILRVLVPRGDDPPYVVDDYKVYVRSELETGLAVRDEIVNLVFRGQRGRNGAAAQDSNAVEQVDKSAAGDGGSDENYAPRTGVEVVEVDERDGQRYYTVRDLRNGNVVKNVNS